MCVASTVCGVGSHGATVSQDDVKKGMLVGVELEGGHDIDTVWPWKPSAPREPSFPSLDAFPDH